MIRLLPFLLLLLLVACVTQPKFEADELAGTKAGDGCWKVGVLEEGNTGRMTTADPQKIRVMKFDYFDLLVMCDEMDYRSLARQRREGNSMIIRGCFQPRKVDGKAGEPMIYLYRFSGKKELYEEQCHALLGPLHNACYPRYGIGASEAACNWAL